ncbi:hypothetical protein HETIRDRAFT_244021, partial [Heterobasidion irregulare TC 32-1]
CAEPCHPSTCPPCAVTEAALCWCGTTTRNVPCSANGGAALAPEIPCDRPCGARARAVRHQCTRVCYPLAALAGMGTAKDKSRKSRGTTGHRGRGL